MEHSQEPKPESRENATAGKSNQHQKPRRQRKNDPNSRPRRQIKYIDPHFRFNKTTVEELFFKKLDTDFLQDLNTYFSLGSNKSNAVSEIKQFLSREENLSDAAKYAHSILEDLTFKCPHPRVPHLVVQTFLKLMIQRRNMISKLLNEKAGDSLLYKIPLQYLVDIVELYDLKLSKKDATIFFKELAKSRSFTEIPRFLKLTGHEFTQELVPVIQKLIDKKQYKMLRMIPNLKKLFKQNKVLAGERSKMINNVAFYHFRSEGWEYLEEIFEFHPSIIAQVISNNFSSRSSKFQKNQKYFQGVVSICERNPAVFEKLRPDTQKLIKEKREQMIKESRPFLTNFLKVDQFEPSSKDHFSFEQFQITQNHVHWVDDKVDNQKLKLIKETLLKSDKIAIDTESTLVRTPIDQDYDVLSLIQISTEEEIYLVDPYNAKHPQIKAIFKEYFGNKNKTVIGHTIYDDVGTVADFFEIGRPTCKIIDIKKEYEGLNSSKQVGLKSISKEILGKEICKKYTMTNWDRRPLNLCQLHYAAMDAYIILKIWDKLSLMIEERKKNPNPIQNKKQGGEKKKAKQSKDLDNQKSGKQLPDENAKDGQIKSGQARN